MVEGSAGMFFFHEGKTPIQVYHLIFVTQDCVVTCGDMIIHKCRNLGYLGRNLGNTLVTLVQCLCCCRLPTASLVKPFLLPSWTKKVVGILCPWRTLSSGIGCRFEKPPELSTFACACNCSWVAAGWLKPRYRGCEITWGSLSDQKPQSI